MARVCTVCLAIQKCIHTWYFIQNPRGWGKICCDSHFTGQVGYSVTKWLDWASWLVTDSTIPPPKFFCLLDPCSCLRETDWLRFESSLWCLPDTCLELSKSHIVICRRKNQDAHNQRKGEELASWGRPEGMDALDWASGSCLSKKGIQWEDLRVPHEKQICVVLCLDSWFHFIHTAVLWGRYYYPHFFFNIWGNRGSEGYTICPRHIGNKSHSPYSHSGPSDSRGGTRFPPAVLPMRQLLLLWMLRNEWCNHRYLKGVWGHGKVMFPSQTSTKASMLWFAHRSSLGPSLKYVLSLSWYFVCWLSTSFLLQSQPQLKSQPDHPPSPLLGTKGTLASSLHWISNLFLCTPQHKITDRIGLYPNRVEPLSDPCMMGSLGGGERCVLPDHRTI